MPWGLARAALQLSLWASGDPVEPPPWQLEWRAPPECPPAAEVRDRITQTLGAAPSSQDPLTARAEVEYVSQTSWMLTLTIHGARGAGTRTIEAASCDELADAAALVIAIAIDPELLASTPAPLAPAPSPQLLPRPAGPTEIATAGPPAPREDHPKDPPLTTTHSSPRTTAPAGLRAGLRIGTGLGIGLLPAPTPTLDLDLGLYGPAWRVDLGGTYWVAQEARAPTNSAVGGSFSLWSINTRGCGVPAVRHLHFPLCAGLDLGQMHGRGTGELAIVNSANAFWAGAHVSAGFMWNWRFLGLWLDGSALFSLTQPEFKTAQTPRVYQAGQFGGHFRLGLELRLPQLLAR